MRAAILAGGEARRFGGRPKGLLRLGSMSLLEHAIAAVSSLDPTPIVIGHAHPDMPAGVVPVPDRRPGCGSLGGLWTALHSTRTATLLVGWDMPFLSAPLLRALTARWHQDLDALLPASDGPRGLEPLCAVYGPGCLPAIERALDRGDLRMTAFHADVRIDVLPQEEVAAFGDPARMFLNVNTPDDLRRAEGLQNVQDGTTA